MKRLVRILLAGLVTCSLCHVACLAADATAADATAAAAVTADAAAAAASTAAAPAAAASAEGSAVIAKPGDTGGNVLTIQKLLATQGYLTGTIDGSYGEATETAVKKYQTEHNLEADGIVTKAVFDLLRQNVRAASASGGMHAISAADIYSEFVANGIAAELKYRGKTVQVMGRIASVDRSSSGKAFVRLRADETGSTGVICYFSDADLAKLAALKREQIVVIQGTCGLRSLSNLEVSDCSLVNKPVRSTTTTTYYWNPSPVWHGYGPIYDGDYNYSWGYWYEWEDDGNWGYAYEWENDAGYYDTEDTGEEYEEEYEED